MSAPPRFADAAATAAVGRKGTPPARALALAAGALGVGIVGFVLFRLGAIHAVAPNSDNATVVLEGAAMRTGNVGLHGWTLSLDSFWTLDAVAYALGVAALGIRPGLMADVPALIAALVLLAAGSLAGAGLPWRGRAIAFGVVAVALLGAPFGFSAFFLAGPYHVVTLLVCLGVFALLAEPTPARALLAGALLVLGLLGDLQTLLLAVAPVLTVAVLELCRKKRAAALRLGLVGVGAAMLAEAAHLAIRAAGGFRLSRANTAASGHQLLRNLAHLPSYLVALFGVTTGPFGPNHLPLVLRLGHVLGIGIGAIAAGLVLLGAWRRLERPLEERGLVMANARLEELLVAGVAFDLLCFVALPIITSPAYGRYLTAGIVETLVLGGALAGRLASSGEIAGHRVERRLGWVLVGVGALGLGAYSATLAEVIGAAPPPAPAVELAATLEHEGLVHGVGDYWSASLTTVDSGGTVEIRPVIAVAGGRLVRYDKQSAASWYAGQRFTYFVYNAALPWNGDTPEAARRTFGTVARTVAVGTYRVLVFARPFSVSTVGSEGP